MEYYSSHTKRIRRKKQRNPHQATVIHPGAGASTGRPLRSEGWAVRYEYKMATFAEFRAEEELARKLVLPAFPAFVTCSPMCLDTTKTVGLASLTCSALLRSSLPVPNVGRRRRSLRILFLSRFIVSYLPEITANQLSTDLQTVPISVRILSRTSTLQQTPPPLR